MPSLMTQVSKHKVLPHEEEVELHNLMREASSLPEKLKAREKLITHNLRLAMKICQEYRNCGMETEDLFSEAVIGLMSAVDKWSPPKGSKLSSYATVWIKQKIKRALSNQSRVVRLPVKKVYDLKRINQTKVSLGLALGREPTQKEISQHSGVSMSVIETINKSIITKPMSLDYVAESRTPDAGSDSSSEKSSLGEAIEDECCLDPLLNAVDSDVSRVIAELLEDLSSRERVIISERFGLIDCNAKTLDEVGADLGITKERVRQIQGEVLKKLRRELEKKNVDSVSLII